MILTQTPLRVSFAGGGSDLPCFYRRFGGAVVSAAVNKYVYIGVNQKFDDAVRVSYSKTEEVASADRLEHKIVREALRLLGIPGGIEITSIADIPSRGTGLGSSSSFTVGLLHALHAYRGDPATAARLAAEACRVEIELCGDPIGKQDQYAAAFGGLNFIRFDPDDSVTVEPIVCSREAAARIRECLLFFYTGKTRAAGPLLAAQIAELDSNVVNQKLLQRMSALAYELRDELRASRVDAFGAILAESWQLKKQLGKEISDSEIDCWYDAARKAGACGGKLLGAGAGGFLAFWAPPERHPDIRRALSFLRSMDLHLDPRGSRITFHQPR